MHVIVVERFDLTTDAFQYFFSRLCGAGARRERHRQLLYI